MGHKAKTEVYIPLREGRHILATGTTGSDKTACISNVIQSAMDQQIVFVVDGKGDKGRYSLYDLMTHLCEKFQKKLYIIDLTEVYKSDKYNPFKNANSTQIKDMLVNMSRWSEEHYKAQASSYWQIMSGAMLLADEPITLHNMSIFSRPAELKDLIKHLAKAEIIDNQTSRDWENIATQNGETAAAASARFAAMIHGAAGAIFSNDNNGIDITEIYEQNACILVLIDAQSYADFAYALEALVIQDIKKLIGHISSLGKHGRKQTLIVFDELGTYLSDEVLNIYNKGRSAGIQAVGMVQSLSDLEKNNPQLKNQIVENCNIFISFRTNDPDGADEISKIFGTENSLEITHKIDGPYKSGSGTAKLIDKFKVDPNSLKELPDNVGYVYAKRGKQGSANTIYEPICFF